MSPELTLMPGKMSPETAGRIVRAVMAHAASKTTPRQFRAWLIGGVLGPVVAGMQDEDWREFLRIEICNEPGCDCATMVEQTVEALDVLRDFTLQHRAERKCQQDVRKERAS